MSLKHQIGEIAGMARSTHNVLHTVAADEVRLGPLANAIVACPDLLDLIKALLVGEPVAEAKSGDTVVLDATGAVSLGLFETHADKLIHAARALRDMALVGIRGTPVDPAHFAEACDAVQKIAAQLPKRGPTIELDPNFRINQDAQPSFKKFAADQEISITAAPGYEQLVQVFGAAHDQAAYGKGKERHANGQPFHGQRMQTISDVVGSPDGMVYQLMKKTTEGLQFESPDKREHELLGALNYLAGIVIWLRRHETAKSVGV